MGFWAKLFGREDDVDPTPRMGEAAFKAASKEIADIVRMGQARIRAAEKLARRDYDASWVDFYTTEFDVESIVDRGHSFARVLARMVQEKCEGRASGCYRRAGISRQLYSRIISDPQKRVEKLTVMRLALGLKLSKDEARELLESAGYAFSRSIYEDVVFSWCIEHGTYSIIDVNELLVKGGRKPIVIV